MLEYSDVPKYQSGYSYSKDDIINKNDIIYIALEDTNVDPEHFPDEWKVIGDIEKEENSSIFDGLEIKPSIRILKGPKGDTGKDGESIKGPKGDTGKDGVGLEFDLSETRLGIKREDEKKFTYVDFPIHGRSLFGGGASQKFHLNSVNTGVSLIKAANLHAATLKSLIAGTGITLTDNGSSITIDGTATVTDEQIQDAVGSIFTDSATIDFTYNDALNQITADVIAPYITLTSLSATSPITYNNLTGVIGFDFSTNNTWTGTQYINTSSTTALQIGSAPLAIFDTVNNVIGFKQAPSTTAALAITENTLSRIVELTRTATTSISQLKSIQVTENWTQNQGFPSPGGIILHFTINDNRITNTGGSGDIVTPVFVALNKGTQAASSTKATPGLNMCILTANEQSSMTYSANIATYTTGFLLSNIAHGQSSFGFTWSGATSFTHVNRWADAQVAFSPTISGAGQYRLNNYNFSSRGTGTTTGDTYGVGFYNSMTGYDTTWSYVNETTTAQNYMGGDNCKTFFGTGAGTVAARTLTSDASIYYDGIDLICNTREIGTGAFNLTYNLKASIAQDVYSQFGSNIGSGIVTAADSSDRLLVTKITSTTTNTRAGLFVNDNSATGTHAAGVSSLNAFATLTSSANYTATNQGGGLRGARYVSSHLGTGLVTRASGITALIQTSNTGNITDAVTFHSESPAVASGLTISTFSAFRARGGTVVGAITSRSGLYVENQLSAGTTNYGVFVEEQTGPTNPYEMWIDGGGGLFLREGTQQVYSSASNTLDLDAGTTQNFRIGGAVEAILTSTGLALQAGASSGNIAKVGGCIFDHFIDAGNSGTTETDLYSDTIPASVLTTNGDKLDVEYGGVFVSSGTATRQIKIYFGGTVIFDTGALTLSLSSAWTVFVTLIRVSSSVVRYMVSLTTQGAALSAYTSVGEVTGLTLSNTNILKITGQAAGVGAATNDIVAKMGSVSWKPAA